MIEHYISGFLIILMEAIGILIVHKQLVGIMTAISIGTVIMFYLV